MRSGRMARRLVATAGMGAIIAMGVLSACAREAPAPEKVTVTETAAPPVEPTEKAPRIEPGPNPFSPSVVAPGPPTPAPGNLPGDN
jgi:hypothetical protein